MSTDRATLDIALISDVPCYFSHVVVLKQCMVFDEKSRNDIGNQCEQATFLVHTMHMVLFRRTNEKGSLLSLSIILAFVNRAIAMACQQVDYYI